MLPFTAAIVGDNEASRDIVMTVTFSDMFSLCVLHHRTKGLEDETVLYNRT